MRQGIPSKRFDVWRRLYQRFLLEPSPAEASRAEVLTSIQPITDVDQIVADSTIRSATFDLTGSSGTFMGFTVPAGERWRTGFIFREATTGNTHMRADLFDEDNALSEMRLSLQGTNEAFLDTRGLVLDEGERIGFNTSQNAGDGSRLFSVEFQLEARN